VKNESERFLLKQTKLPFSGIRHAIELEQSNTFFLMYLNTCFVPSLSTKDNFLWFTKKYAGTKPGCSGTGKNNHQSQRFI